MLLMQTKEIHMIKAEDISNEEITREEYNIYLSSKARMPSWRADLTDTEIKKFIKTYAIEDNICIHPRKKSRMEEHFRDDDKFLTYFEKFLVAETELAWYTYLT